MFFATDAHISTDKKHRYQLFFCERSVKICASVAISCSIKTRLPWATVQIFGVFWKVSLPLWHSREVCL